MYKKQLVHTRESIAAYSLSPYVIINYGEKNVMIYSKIAGKIINIKGNHSGIEQIINRLVCGIYYDDLCTALKQELNEEEPEIWIGIAIQAGIIE